MQCTRLVREDTTLEIPLDVRRTCGPRTGTMVAWVPEKEEEAERKGKEWKYLRL